MISNRDGHVRVLPLHVANKIAAGEVVERPASVVKELVENAIDAGAKRIAIAITQGGRKLVSVQDDGVGMTKDDAVLSLERQATSKIRDVTDIEEIDTLGFRGEAIPSIASVSRFSLTTRRADSDEGTFLQVNAGTLAEVRAAGCPVGTLVEVRDLFCNVPARRKFLRAYATEENHVKQVFSVHALAHPSIGFSLTVDGRELYRLAPAASLRDRVLELFGPDFLATAVALSPSETEAASRANAVRVTGFIERPNLSTPTRREQYVFVNGRPASSPSVAYALKEGYPRRIGDSRPAAVIFIDLPPNQVDVNVHPTKREVRFRDNFAVKTAILDALESALKTKAEAPARPPADLPILGQTKVFTTERTLPAEPARTVPEPSQAATPIESPARTVPEPSQAATPIESPARATPEPSPTAAPVESLRPEPPQAMPVAAELPIAANEGRAKPWAWFKFLAQAASGYLLIETDAGIVTINPHAARERIVYERLLNGLASTARSQALLIPETVRLTPVEFSRIAASLDAIRGMGFQLEEFGRDTFKIDAVPQAIGTQSPSSILATIARDLAEGGSRRSGERWREELIAKSVAKSFAGASLTLNEAGAVALVEELCTCRMPYVCPRGKPVMIFTSTRELDRKFDRN